MERNAAMRRVKFISLLMSILSSLVIFSIGFSSWIEFAPLNASSSGSFTTYDILTIENTEMSVFQFSATAFKEVAYEEGGLKTYTDTQTGVITVTYKVPAASVKAANGKIHLDISLGYVGAKINNLFATTFPTSSTTNFLNVKIGTEAVTPQITTNESGEEVINIQKTYSNMDQTKDFEFTVTYEFNIPYENMNFRNTFGKYITGSDGTGTPTKFTASAYVTNG